MAGPFCVPRMGGHGKLAHRFSSVPARASYYRAETVEAIVVGRPGGPGKPTGAAIAAAFALPGCAGFGARYRFANLSAEVNHDVFLG